MHASWRARIASHDWLPLGLLLFAAAMHWVFASISVPRLSGDAARLGLHTLDFLQRGVWPFYIYHLFAPNPLIIFLQAPTFLVFGFNRVALESVPTFAGILASPAAYWACRELLADHGSQVARRAGVIAALSLPFSTPLNTILHTGTEHGLLPVLELMTVATLWRGLRRGRPMDFGLAGLLLGLSQYAYIVARAVPVALAAVIMTMPVMKHGGRAHWRGLALAALTTTIMALPQWLLFINYPYTFFARTGQSAGQFIASVPGFPTLLVEKATHLLLSLGWRWDSGYNPGARPLLNPVLLVGFVVAIIAGVRSRRLTLPLLAAFMLLPDLITYEGLWPSATRLIGAIPFVVMLASAGCALAWNWLERHVRPGPWAGAFILALLLAAGAESQWLRYALVQPQEVASQGFEWKTSEVEIAEAGFISQHRDAPLLIPSSEYERAPLAFLVAEYFPNRTGSITPPLQPGERVQILQPALPDRPTTDGVPANYIPGAWVLLQNGTVHFLPPLSGSIEVEGAPQPVYASNDAVAAYALEARWIGRAAPVEAAAISFANGLDLVGYHVTGFAPGGTATVTLYWRLGQNNSADTQIFVQILDRNHGTIAGIHDWPLHGTYRVRAWRPGETMPLSYRFLIPPNTPPGGYRLTAGVFDLLRQDRVATAAGLDSADVTRLKIPLPAAATTPDRPISVLFGDSIELTGYTLEPSDQGLRLQLFWAARQQPEWDYTVFVHVTDVSGQIVAQSDLQPYNGQYPTSLWSPGERIVDERKLNLPAGQYQLFVGLYRWDTQERLRAQLGGRRLPEDRVPLTTFIVP